MYTPYSPPVARGLIPVAQYARMSTNMQQYSIANQTAAIAAYAEANGMQVVRTFEDGGISGLGIEKRKGLQDLLSTVQNGRAHFKFVLVYDVSRWGRFQNVDAAAYYDYHCSLYGTPVIYIAEGFGTDGSAIASIYKNMKRAAAADYSKDLSAKVSAGKKRLAQMGFYMGGTEKYGLRRLIVNPDGSPRMELEPGQRKALQSDRIVQVPGSAEEVAVVRRIFKMFLRRNIPSTDIANVLRAEGVTTRAGEHLTHHAIMLMLATEAYAGNSVWGKRRAYLGGPQIPNPEEEWVRKDNCIEAIIDAKTFARVQKKLIAEKTKRSPERMLDELRKTLAVHGRISRKLIRDEGGFGIDSYKRVFGDLPTAFRLIGYEPNREFDIMERWSVRLRTYAFVHEFASQIVPRGCKVAIDRHSYSLTINDRWSVGFRATRLSPRGNFDSWPTLRRPLVRYDFLVFARMNIDGITIRDFLVVPRAEQDRFPMVTRIDTPPAVQEVVTDSLDELMNLLCQSNPGRASANHLSAR